MYNNLCSYENLLSAYLKARKNKSKKRYVIEFEKNLMNNIKSLRTELLFHYYTPRPLKTFILRDPKTRKISKSHFRDRVIHHAIINILEPIYDKTFIYDSYASRKNKGAQKAVKRLIKFQNKVTKNGKSVFLKKIKGKELKLIKGYCFKADIKHYFQEMNHNVLVKILKRKIKDNRVIWLIVRILKNFPSKVGEPEKGIPLGNYTSQFFANLYLNELDYFIKHKLEAKYYIRYVDDFVILHGCENTLREHKNKIQEFLLNELKIELHPDKSRIGPLYSGTDFLGFRIFQKYILLRRRNIRKIKSKIKKIKNSDELMDCVEGFLAYSNFANCHKLKYELIKNLDRKIWYKDINRYLSVKFPD
jgi:retron-type reverse transcriptase